jgi:phage tail sheath gpL-like
VIIKVLNFPPVRKAPIRTPEPAVLVQLNDSGQKVRVTGRNTFRLSGAARGDSFIELQFEGKTVRVPLTRGMTPAQTADGLMQALPEGYSLGRHEAGGELAVAVFRATRPVEQLLFTGSDPAQRYLWQQDNAFIIQGTATNSGFVPSYAEAKFEGRTVRVAVARGDTAREVAKKLGSALPRGVVAQIQSHGRDAVVVHLAHV